MAAADYTSLVQSIYVSYFGRPADTFGLANFAAQLDALKAPTTARGLTDAYKTNAALRSLIDSFGSSAESTALYGAAGTDTVAFVSAIYTNLLNRTADFEGLVFWTNEINAGRLTRANASLAIMAGATDNTSAQGLLDAKVVATKVAVATTFTAHIDTGAELAAYSGNAAAAAARGMLAQVTAATDPVAFTANVDATIAAIVVASAPTTTTNLGVGIDAFAGTTANDTFNALSINAITGADDTTLGAFDSINGASGNDTLNIFSKAGINIVQQGTVSSVETINIYNEGLVAADQFGGATGVDASKFVGATAIWQNGPAANAVINLGTTTTAGFRGTTGQTLSVTAAGSTAAIALDAVKGALADNVVTVAVSGSTLANVALSGNIAKADPALGSAKVALNVTAGKDVQTFSLNTGLTTTLVVTEDVASTKMITTVDATASTGAVTFVGDAAVANIFSGAGADKITLATTTNAASTGIAAISAAATTNAGNDTVTVATTGDGATTITTGAGDDTVNVTTRGTGKLTVSLGDGVDKFTSAVPVTAGDSIDAGAGVDTLALALVGSANIGAFAGFDVFDTAALGTKTLDVDILATKNTVTEFVASGNIGGTASLVNIGAGVGFRSTADFTGIVELTQKVAGALTITVDADETATADTAIDTATATVVATNATSVNAVFDTAFKAAIAGEIALGDNVATLNLTANDAAAVSVVSGGALANNVLNLTSAGVESLTITGASKLTLTTTNAADLMNIDALAMTGGLVVSTAAVGDTGTIKLGSGVDAITATATSVATGIESILGFEKAAAAAVGADAAAATAAQADADVIGFGGAAAVADSAGGVYTGGTIAKGVLTFTGAGPSDLGAAILIADAAAETAGEVVVFEYLGNSYVFEQAGATDIVVRLTGTVGITQIAEVGATDTFFIV